MKIALLAGASSIHTIRWANGLNAAGIEVHLITQQPVLEHMDQGIKVHQFPFRGVMGYFIMVPGVKNLLSRVQPDMVNAHFASGYGTTARLTGFRPWLLNVWGSDVYDFPEQSPLHLWWVRKNLLSADQVASTSHCMAEQTRKIAPTLKNIAITPFGVDVDVFAKAAKPLESQTADQPIVLGTVKKLAPKYGVDTLILAFSILKKRLHENAPEVEARLRLRIVGDGPDRGSLTKLAHDLGIRKVTNFVGRVPHADVPGELAILDVYVALSRLESFGVAILEAGAARRPVVVSRVGGLPEVVKDGETGIVVPPDDPEAAADALERLVLDYDLRRQMGDAGARHVTQYYSWKASVQNMIQLYERTIKYGKL